MNRGRRWLIATSLGLAGFGGCWAGLAASRIFDTGSQIGVASVPLVVLLGLLGAWAERGRGSAAPEATTGVGVMRSPQGTAVGSAQGSIVFGSGTHLTDVQINTGARSGEEPLRPTAPMFTEAVELLGSEDQGVRVGAVYALENIMQGSGRDHPFIVEVLASFVRRRSPAEDIDDRGAPSPFRNDESRVSARLPEDVQAALKVLGRRPAGRQEHERLNLSSVNLSNADLRGGNFAGAILSGSNLSGAKLQHANLEGITAYRAWFYRSVLTDANLTGARMDEAVLTRAAMTRVVLVDSTLRKAVLSHAYLRNANLRGSKMTKAEAFSTDMTGADLTGAQLGGANLKRALLKRANLSDAKLRGADLMEADFRFAKLTGADLTSATRTRAKFEGAEF